MKQPPEQPEKTIKDYQQEQLKKIAKDLRRARKKKRRCQPGSRRDRRLSEIIATLEAKRETISSKP